MSNFLVSLNVVAPLFLLMSLGFGVRHLKWVGDQTVRQMNYITFRIFLPTMLFVNIISCDLSQDFDGEIIIAAVCISFASALLTWGIAFLVEKESTRRAALAQGMFRNNYILFGIPIMSAIYGASSTRYISMLLACIIPLNNILAVIQMKLTVGKIKGLGSVGRGVLTNPFVIASVLGFLFLFAKISLPGPINKSINNIAIIANPLSLILLGASLEFRKIRGYLKDILIGCGTKLLLLPLVFVTIFALLGLRGERLLALFIATATPAAVSSQVMAREMGGDGDLAGHLVVFGTAFSVLTIFIWVYIMNFFQLL